MARSIPVSPKKLVAGEKYIQLNKKEDQGKCIKGEAIFKQATTRGYDFEDMQGTIHTLSEKDLTVNPMYMDTVSTTKMYQKQKENRIAEQGGVNKHDPMTIIKTAHKEKYGTTPQVPSFGLIQEDNKGPLLGYRVNINKQDYLLVLDKKENGKADYTNYVYGMLFTEPDYVKPEDLKEGKYYYVDNIYAMYKGMQNGVRLFEAKAAKTKYQNLNCTDNYINIYHNIQTRKREAGKLEKTSPAREVAADAKNKVLQQELFERQTKLTAQKKSNEEKIKEYKSVAQEIFDKRNPYTKEDRVFAGYANKDNKNRVPANALVEGNVYLTPFGELTYKKHLKKVNSDIVKIIKNNKTEPTSEKANQIYVNLLNMGDLKTADYLKANRVLYEFETRAKESIYFIFGDIVSGIITKPLVEGATYITPNGFATYKGMNISLEDLRTKSLQSLVANKSKQLQGGTPRDLKTNPVKSMKDLHAFEKECQNYESMYEDIIKYIYTLKPFTFLHESGESTDYGYGLIMDGTIRPVTAEEKEQAFKELQAQVKKHQREVDKQILQKQRNVKFEAVENVNKVPANKLVVNTTYTTPRGQLTFVKKEKNEKTKKENYHFVKPFTGETKLILEFSDIVAGYVSNDLIPTITYILDNIEVRYFGQVDNPETGEFMYYNFIDKNNKEYRVSYKAIQQGRLQPKGAVK